MRLLLIEDEPELSALVSGNLSRAGFAVDTAQSLDEAGAAVKSMNYDAILLDLRLPDGDGLTLLKSLRSQGDKTPVIVLTARDAVADRVRGLNAGADDYLIKPFAIEELVARINAVLRRPNDNLDLRLRLANLEFDTAHRGALVERSAPDIAAARAWTARTAASPGRTGRDPGRAAGRLVRRRR